ncbi:MAG: DUF2079 domain-containing protein, partial [Planctomycetes bacterium]|nr:DUF2079 domain-containing protein [Planctomycetota bacterium]
MGFGVSAATASVLASAILVLAAGWATGAFLALLSASTYELWKNTLTFDREALEGLAASGVRWAVALLAAWTLLAVLAARRSGASLAHTLKPTAIAFTPLLALFGYGAWTALGGQITFASLFVFTVLVGLVAVLHVQILTTRRPWAEPSDRQSWALVAGASLLFLLVFGALDVLGYRSLFLGYHDTGIYAEALWNTLQGEILKSNRYEGFSCYLGDHLALGLLAFVPLYCLAPNPQTLLLTQTTLLAAGAIPVYLLARNSLGSNGAGVAFVLAYLLFPAVGHANLNLIGGFTPDGLSILPLLWVFYLMTCALDRGTGERIERAGRKASLTWFFVCVFLALISTETAAIVVLMAGLYMSVWLRPRRVGLVVLILGIGWFFMATLVVIPYFSGRPYWHAPQFYGDMGESFAQLTLYAAAHPLDLLRRCLSHSQLMFLLQLLVPLGLLLLLAPSALLIAAPTLLALLVAKDPSLHSILLHYRSSVIPVLFFAAIEGARRQAEGTSWIQRLLA